MSQAQIDRAVAHATGETLGRIGRMGFGMPMVDDLPALPAAVQRALDRYDVEDNDNFEVSKRSSRRSRAA